MDDVIIMTPLDQKELHTEIAHMFFDILEKTLAVPQTGKVRVLSDRSRLSGDTRQNGELMIDPAKIAGIRDWPTTLKNVKEVRSTLGLLGYHHPWIPNFLKNCQTSYGSIRKRQRICVDQICEDAVKKLIGLVTSEPVIVPPDPDRQFILYVDASQFATGAVLYQPDLERTDCRGKPVTPTHWIPLANIQQSRAELPHLRQGTSGLLCED